MLRTTTRASLTLGQAVAPVFTGASSDLTVTGCSFRCRPSPCGRLSRPRSTTAAPSRLDPISRQRTQPVQSWLAASTVGQGRDGSRVHLLPIDEGGAQLDPDGPWPHAADLQARLPATTITVMINVMATDGRLLRNRAAVHRFPARIRQIGAGS